MLAALATVGTVVVPHAQAAVSPLPQYDQSSVPSTAYASLADGVSGSVTGAGYPFPYQDEVCVSVDKTVVVDAQTADEVNTYGCLDARSLYHGDVTTGLVTIQAAVPASMALNRWHEPDHTLVSHQIITETVTVDIHWDGSAGTPQPFIPVCIVYGPPFVWPCALPGFSRDAIVSGNLTSAHLGSLAMSTDGQVSWYVGVP